MKLYDVCKQNTAFEMRISDWSSDVCSSDLGIPWRLRNAVCRGFLGKYGYVTLFRGASRCELESAGRCLFGNLPYPFDPPGDDRQDFRQRGQSAFPPARSEEHTSELQSLMRNSYAVFCLKKKSKQKKSPQTHNM